MATCSLRVVSDLERDLGTSGLEGKGIPTRLGSSAFSVSR